MALGVLDGLLHAGEHVVEALAGVVDVGGDDLLAHAAARAGRELVDDLTEVVLGKAGVLHEVGVPGSGVLADVHEVGALLAHGDLCASLGKGKRGLRAGMAATDDDGVEVVDLLGDLYVVGHAQPVTGACVAEGASLSGSCLAGQRAMFRTEDIAGFFFRVGILMRMLKETELVFQLQDAQDTLVDQ